MVTSAICLFRLFASLKNIIFASYLAPTEPLSNRLQVSKAKEARSEINEELQETEESYLATLFSS